MATLQDYLGITKLRDAWPKWKANIIAINTQIINHVAGTADKHAAEKITYSGSFTSKTDVKAALDQAKTEIDTIVVSASIDPEVALARQSSVKAKTFTTLDARFEETEQDLVSYKADNMQYLINVKHPPLTMVSAKGDEVTDDTVAINAMVQYVKTNKLGGLYFPDSSGAYMIDGNDPLDLIYYNANGGIVIDSPFRLIMHPNATLKAITSDKNGYCVLNIKDASDVYVEGGKIIGERSTHIGIVGEHGMGISITNSTNIHINNTIISDCWGDGIIVMGRDGYPLLYSEDVFITNVICKNNRRQGMSIVSAKKVYVTSSEFSDTNGTLPQSGIDIEANATYPDNEDILISNCVFKNNTGVDITIATRSKNVAISNNTMVGSAGAAVVIGYGAVTNGVLISGNLVDGLNVMISGISVLGNNSAIINGNTIRNIIGTESPGIYISDNDLGKSVLVTNNDISFCRYGIIIDAGAVSNAEISNNIIHDVLSHAIYIHTPLSYSSIIGNTLYNLGTTGINSFNTLKNVLISNNCLRNGQQFGLTGDFSDCVVSQNIFIDMGLESTPSDYPSISLTSTIGANFIFGNRVRNLRVGYVGIRNNAVPATPNIVSKNDLRYAVVGQVLSLHASDISDGNFTL